MDIRNRYGPNTISRNRYQAAVPLVASHDGYDASGATCQSTMIWDAALGITELLFYAKFLGAAAEDSLHIVLNAPSDAVAKSWLTVGEDAITDRQFYEIPLGQYVLIPTTGVTRVDLAGYNCTPDVWCGAN